MKTPTRFSTHFSQWLPRKHKIPSAYPITWQYYSFEAERGICNESVCSREFGCSSYSCSIWLHMKYSYHNTHRRSNMYCFRGTTWFLAARKNTFCYPGDTWLLLQVSCISAASCQQIRWTERSWSAAIGWRTTVVLSHWLAPEKRCFPMVSSFPLSVHMFHVNIPRANSESG